MKKTLCLAVFVALAAFAVQAQTIIPLRITAAQTNVMLDIPTNTLALLNPGIANATASCFVHYPGFDPIMIGPAHTQQDYKMPEKILGPCVLELRLMAIQQKTNFIAQILVELQPVNTTSPAALVQPSGFAASVKLETSSDLSNWQTLTNASFNKADGNRFFRTSLTLP